MKTIRLAWGLFRLARYLQTHRVEGACASVSILQEKTGSSTYFALLEEAKKAGLPPPKPRMGAEVGVWLDIGAPHKVYNGLTLQQALDRALEHAPSPE